MQTIMQEIKELANSMTANQINVWIAVGEAVASGKVHFSELKSLIEEPALVEGDQHLDCVPSVAAEN